MGMIPATKSEALMELLAQGLSRFFHEVDENMFCFSRKLSDERGSYLAFKLVSGFAHLLVELFQKKKNY